MDSTIVMKIKYSNICLPTTQEQKNACQSLMDSHNFQFDRTLGLGAKA